MSLPPLFYLAPDKWHPPFSLSGSEFHHFRRVLRLRSSDLIRLFDGQGRIGTFLVNQVERHSAQLNPISTEVFSKPNRECHLALGWNKGLRRGWLLEKAAEMGATSIIFWTGARSQGSMPLEEKSKWEAQLLAGAKQSGNPWLPEIRLCPGGVNDLVKIIPDFDALFVFWEEEKKSQFSIDDFETPGRYLVVIGPEGGLSSDEAEQLQHLGFQAKTLGSRMLRWETAALVCLSVFWLSIHCPGHKKMIVNTEHSAPEG